MYPAHAMWKGGTRRGSRRERGGARGGRRGGEKGRVSKREVRNGANSRAANARAVSNGQAEPRGLHPAAQDGERAAEQDTSEAVHIDVEAADELKRISEAVEEWSTGARVPRSVPWGLLRTYVEGDTAYLTDEHVPEESHIKSALDGAGESMTKSKVLASSSARLNATLASIPLFAMSGLYRTMLNNVGAVERCGGRWPMRKGGHEHVTYQSLRCS